MTTAQAMEEELQQSVLRSEDASWETNQVGTDPFNINTAQRSVNGTIFIAPNGITRAQSETQDDGASDHDASGEELEEDASGEEELDMLQETQGNISAHIYEGNQLSRSDEGEDEDASGEDEEEAVGAVKIQPSSVVDELDSDDDSDVSEAPSAIEEDRDSDEEEDEEEEGVWEDARDMVGEEGEEEDSDTGPSNVCMFCKQDEEHDPSEDFESYLACSACGENGECFSSRNETDP